MFIDRHNDCPWQLATVTASTSICITALGLAFVDFGYISALVAAAAGLAIACLIGGKIAPVLSLIFSMCCLALHLQGIAA